MPTRLLPHIDGGRVFETYDHEEEGECSVCLAPVVKVVGSNFTCNTDGTRYSHDPSLDAWGLFRCGQCEHVVSDTWRPKTTVLQRVGERVRRAWGRAISVIADA